MTWRTSRWFHPMYFSGDDTETGTSYKSLYCLVFMRKIYQFCFSTLASSIRWIVQVVQTAAQWAGNLSTAKRVQLLKDKLLKALGITLFSQAKHRSVVTENVLRSHSSLEQWGVVSVHGMDSRIDLILKVAATSVVIEAGQSFQKKYQKVPKSRISL